MSKVAELLNKSFDTAKRMRKLLFLVAAIDIACSIVGYLMVYFQTSLGLKFTEWMFESVSAIPVFTTIGALVEENLALAISLVFLVNLSNAAFATQTLPGVIPILGGIGIVGVSAFRAFMAGVVNYYVLGVSIGFAVLGIGTSLLELTAYIFSASAGINISLSVIFPRRYGVEGRWTAFKMAWKDAGRLYVIVIILLALGAIWEVGGAALGRG